MSKNLDLLYSYEQFEKRVFPRYPLSFLTFRMDDAKAQNFLTYEVKDISMTGMQLEKKHGEVEHKKGDQISGSIHWFGEKCDIQGTVQWALNKRVGVSFKNSKTLENKLENFLNIDQIIKHMRPLHQQELDFDDTEGLKYWLQSEGPVEVFVWQGAEGINKLQVVYFQQFLEWTSKTGLKTGRIISKRDLETPLWHHDEFGFEMHRDIDQNIVEQTLALLAKIPSSYVDESDRSILVAKLT